MVRIFDLPPGGLQDGSVGVEVNPDGTPVREIIHGGEERSIFKRNPKTLM